jgi:hypothetical protein
MANVKISELTPITCSVDLADADIVPIVDNSGSCTKRVALSVLNDFFGGIWCTGTNTAYLLTDCVGIGTATPGTDIMFRVQGDSCYTGDLKIGGDVCIGGDDLFMNTNTSGYMLIADGTNFNPVAMSGDVAIDNAGATTIQATSVDNSMLAGSIANAKLSNSSISYGGISLSLGGTDATPAFNLCDATAYKGDSALVTVGTIASGTWNGTAIANGYLANSSVSYGGVLVSLGSTDTTPAFNLCDATAYKGDSALVTVGTVTSGTWQGTAIATGYIASIICDKTLASPVLCGTISGNALLDEDNMASNSATKVASQQSIKSYVDSVASGLDLKCSSHAATTSNLSAVYSNGSSGVGATLTNNSTQAALSVDGQTMTSAERVLVKDQSTAAQNGIYTVTTVGSISTNWVLTRATDFDTATEITSGAFTFVETGSSYADSGWVMTTDGTVTVGTTSLAWAQFSGAGQITAGNGLTKSGNTLNVGVGSNLSVGADSVAMCSVVTSLTTVCATNFAGTLATAAQTNVTSLGTLTALTVDNICLNGATIGHTSDTDLITLAAGSVTIAGNVTGATAICTTNLNASSVYIGGTTSANQLDNYVEGTFTPAYTAGVGSITLSTAEGYYTRIGNLIYVTIKMIASSISSPSGTLVISGLPITSANNTGGEGIGTVVHKNLVIQTLRSSPYIPFKLTGGGTDNIPITSVRAYAVVRVVANSTTAKLSYADNDVSYTDAVASDIAADTEIQASFFYQA